MAVTIQFKRGTKAELDLLASRRGLSEGEPFLLTDEGRVAIATSISTYTTFALQGEPAGSAELPPPTQITKSLLIQTGSWMDTGIVYNDVPPGTYIIEMYANDQHSKNLWYSGLVSWNLSNNYSTGDDPTDEILLNSTGSSSIKSLFLRTFVSNSPLNLKLQVYSNYTNNNSYNYVFRFRKII